MSLWKKQYETALRDPVIKWIEQLEHIDILVGIPTYNNDDTVGYVVSQVGEGLNTYFKGLRTAIFVADGGSVDDTREHIQIEKIPEGIEKQVTIYRGIPGKGTSFRAVFECAARLRPKAILVFDSDLRSITPEWVKWMAEPILSGSADFCAPYYRRHPFDGTITNMIVYPMTVAVFGKDIRQPIGGDFSFSLSLAEYMSSQQVWLTDVAQFGIDIWMTLTALNESCKILQVDLGNKVHNQKDPSVDLSTMFSQVISTLFYIMKSYEKQWRKDYDYSEVELISFDGSPAELERVHVSFEKLKREFEEGFNHFKPMYRNVLEHETFGRLSDVVSRLREKDEFMLDAELWSKILYDFFFTFNLWERNRRRLVDIITPLYFGRTGSYFTEVMDKSWEEAEGVIKNQMEVFRKNRDYLIKKYEVWD